MATQPLNTDVGSGDINFFPGIEVIPKENSSFIAYTVSFFVSLSSEALKKVNQSPKE